MSRNAQRSEGVSVVTLLPRDEVDALRLSTFAPVLCRQLQRCIRGLTAGVDEDSLHQPSWRTAENLGRQFLRHITGIFTPRVYVADLVELLNDGRSHLWLAMPED